MYYAPRGESAENLALMRRMDALSLQYPFYGSRQMARHLRREGVAAGRRRVRRLMGLMGLEAIYRKPRTSDAQPDHHVYPYLLRELKIDRPDQVWCADITYIPVTTGFLYLVAIMDWASRHVTWSRWFGQLEGLVKVYSDCEITPSSSSAPALTGGCHGWHDAGSYPVIDDDDALWNCGNLAAGAQARAAALAREISNGLWAPASPPSGFSATVSGRPQAGQVHSAGWDMVLGPLMR